MNKNKMMDIINPAIAQIKNQVADVNTAMASTCCNLNSTNILNFGTSYDYDITDYNINNKQIDILWDAIEVLQKQMNNAPKIVKLTCMNCGGQVEQKYNDYIFKCPYCKTVYALGTKQIYKN